MGCTVKYAKRTEPTPRTLTDKQQQLLRYLQAEPDLTPHRIVCMMNIDAVTYRYYASES